MIETKTLIIPDHFQIQVQNARDRDALRHRGRVRRRPLDWPL